MDSTLIAIDRADAIAQTVSGDPAPCCVLDTNVVLDWAVFGDPHGLAIGQAIVAGELTWLLTPAMHEELLDVLARLRTHPSLQRWQHREEPAIELINAWAHTVLAPDPLPPHQQAHCSDPDDQMFLDLAVARRVPWLLSRDRAVLHLAKRVRPWGVTVLTPQRWVETQRASLLADPCATA
jgi:predicted nucleic acid-binding protein